MSIRIFTSAALAVCLAGPVLAQELLEPVSSPPLSESSEEDGAWLAQERTMRVDRFELTGNQLIPTSELESIYAEFQGKELTLAQMKELAAKVTDHYQKAGFLLVKAIIPKQSFANNQVTIKVVEGRLGKVDVHGSEHYDSQWIKEYVSHAYRDGGLKKDDLVRTLMLLNEFEDLDVKVNLKPGQEVGTVDVNVKVEDQCPLHFGLDYNNYGTPETGVNRLGLNMDVGNLFSQGDRLGLRGVIGFPSRGTNYFQVNYDTPINFDGTQIGFGYANGAFSVSQGLGAILDIRGSADIFTASVAHPLERSFDHSSNLALTLAHKDVQNDFFGGQFPFTRDRYTSARLSYQADWRGPDGRTLFQGGWTQGLGGTSASDPLVSRSGASGGFGKLNLELARVQTLDTGLYGVLRGSAQVATQPLYLAEQFALGGPDTVRGFSQAELLGDDGYVLSAELRWSPFDEDLDRFQMSFFVDHGGVSVKRPQPGDFPNGRHLTGAGTGFRLGLGSASHFRLDLGFPISPTRNRQGVRPAVYAGLTTRF